MSWQHYISSMYWCDCQKL